MTKFFRTLTPLSAIIPIVPNNQYLTFHLWSILSEEAKEQVASHFRDDPNPALHYKALRLVQRFVEYLLVHRRRTQIPLRSSSSLL